MTNYHAQYAARLVAFNDGYKNYFKFLYANLAKIAPGGVLIIEGHLSLDFFSGWKGGQAMKPRNKEELTQQTFDSFCKKVLKRAALDFHREIKRRSKREVVFSDMSARDMAALSVTDEYFTDEFVFNVFGESIGVTDADLAEALNALPADKRDIVLMSFFFDMTDREIAERLNMARRTVAHYRKSTLRELRNLLESEE